MDSLAARLRKFPKFFSHDEARWYRSTETEPLALEAALKIESLEAALGELVACDKDDNLDRWSALMEAAWTAARSALEVGK